MENPPVRMSKRKTKNLEACSSAALKAARAVAEASGRGTIGPRP